jgi:small subunit ribosomal protein S3Ae
MSQKVKKKTKAKSKKVSFKDKIWYDVLAPRNFNFKSIGQIVGADKSIVGRDLEVLLFDFTDNYNDINLKLRFKIVNLNSEAKKGNTVFIGHEYTNDYIRALIGRGSTKITTIQNLTTKDGYVYRVTSLCNTLKRARSSQQLIVRKIMTELLKEFAKNLNHEKFIVGMIFGEFQNQISRTARTIYPLSSSVIIKSRLLSIPEGGVDSEVPDKEFEIVEVDIKRSRKSEMRRTERINVKNFAPSKETGEKPHEEEITNVKPKEQT